MKLCVPKPLGYYFVQVLPENKQEVLELLQPWDIADIVFSTTPNGEAIYYLYCQDALDEAPNGPQEADFFTWGYSGDYLLRNASTYADEEEPGQISKDLFDTMYVVADAGNVLPVTAEAINSNQEAYDAWYEQEYADSLK